MKCVRIGCLVVLGLFAGKAAPRAQVTHASPELLKLADDFHAFRSPIFRARTWRPTHAIPEGVPDYATIAREQIGGLPKFQARLTALDSAKWPVHDQVDYLLLRSEMDDVDFEHRVLRETVVNPAFYIEQALTGIIRQVHFAVVPYSAQKAEAIITAFDHVTPIVDQGPKNVVLAEAAPELARLGLGEIKNVRANFAAGVKLFEPHVPDTVPRTACGVRRSRRCGAATLRRLDPGESSGNERPRVRWASEPRLVHEACQLRAPELRRTAVPSASWRRTAS